MGRETRRPAPPAGTKGALVETTIKVLPKYQRKLIRDLVYGSVRLPTDWLSPSESAVVPLDEDAVLGGQQTTPARTYWAPDRAVREFIPTLIEGEITRRHGAGVPLEGRERKTLRRGRGPAAVRSLLFRVLPGRPERPPNHLGHDIACVVEEVLGRRATSTSAASVAAQAVPLLEHCRLVVLEFAHAKRLGRLDVAWLVSEVVDQLVCNADHGRLPDNLRAWTLATASAKWRRRPHVQGGSAQPTERDTGASDPLHDEVAERLDTQHAMHGAGQHMAMRAELLAEVGETLNAATHAAAARILLTGTSSASSP